MSRSDPSSGSSRRCLLTALAWLCVGLVPGALTAQQGQSVLSLLPTEGRTVSVGQEVHGELRDTDYLSYNGRHIQAWEIRGRAGQSVVVDLVSDPLDPYLIVVGPGLGEGLTDDDGGSGLDSRLCVEFPQSGRYRIVASALGSRTGPYTLRVRAAETDERCDEEGDWETGPEVDLEDLSYMGTLRPGGSVQGRLERGDPVHRGGFVQAWALEARAGQSLAIDLTSDPLDPYLFVQGPGLGETLTDDDGGDGFNSRLCFVAPESGTYRVVASTFGDEEPGSYRLVVTTVPAPGEPGACEDYEVGGETAMGGEPTVEYLTSLPTVGTLSPGYEHEGTLTSDDPLVDGSYAHAWQLHGTAGESVTIELVSGDFDCYLYMTGPGLGVLRDDDGAGNLDSQIVVTFPETGTYTVVATTFGDLDTGAYSIRTFRSR